MELVKFYRWDQVVDKLNKVFSDGLTIEHIYPKIINSLVYAAKTEDTIKLYVQYGNGKNHYETFSHDITKVLPSPYLVELTLRDFEFLYNTKNNISNAQLSYKLANKLFVDSDPEAWIGVLTRNNPNGVPTEYQIVEHDLDVAKYDPYLEEKQRFNSHPCLDGKAYIFGEIVGNISKSNLAITEDNLNEIISSLGNHKDVDKEDLSEKQRFGFLKIIGALASTIANDHGPEFKNGNDVNVSAVTRHVLKNTGENIHGVSRSTLNEKINEGLKKI